MGLVDTRFGHEMMFIVEVQCQKPVTGHWTVYISTHLMLLVLSIDTYLPTYSMEQSPS